MPERQAEASTDVQDLARSWREFSTSARRMLEAVAPSTWQRETSYAGWTSHDLLAHLSSTQRALPRLLESAFSAPATPGSTEPFDPDRWNASQIRRRRDQPEATLLEELEAGGQGLAAAIEERVGSKDLERPVPTGAGRGNPLGAVLRELLEHQRRHLNDLLKSLQ